MIPQRDLSWQQQSWQEQLRNAIKSPQELLRILDLSEQDIPLSHQADKQFPLFAPQSFVSRMGIGNKQDPLLRQVLNLKDEDIVQAGHKSDPLNEAEFNPLKGLIKKYKNRVLLVTTSICAINCRYCFRREFPYGENNPGKSDWQQVFDYIAADSAVDEVVLSGGDPLVAGDKHLQWLLENISAIATVKRLRIHTRMPIVIPDRVTTSFTNLLKKNRMTTTVVLHINHANEIDEAVRVAAKKLKSSVDFLLNQSVLLREVNDDLESQIQLQRACTDAGILPYYLHFLDPVNGTSHFRVSKKDALSLYNQMQRELSGYMLPKLVVEIPDTDSKQFLR